MYFQDYLRSCKRISENGHGLFWRCFESTGAPIMLKIQTYLSLISIFHIALASVDQQVLNPCAINPCVKSGAQIFPLYVS